MKVVAISFLICKSRFQLKWEGTLRFAPVYISMKDYNEIVQDVGSSAKSLNR